MKIYLAICVVLSFLFGVVSALTGINPFALVLGTIALVVMSTCTVAPLFIDMERIH
ncbi:MAG: hypothetical protein AAGC72_07500 [Planctomycetota bacterium]